MTLSFLKKNWVGFTAVSIAVIGNIFVCYVFSNHIMHKASLWVFHLDAFLAFLNTCSLYYNGTLLIFLWRKEYDSIPANDEIADNHCCWPLPSPPIFKSDFSDWCTENKIDIECYWEGNEFDGFRQVMIVKNLLNYKSKLILLRLKV